MTYRVDIIDVMEQFQNAHNYVVKSLGGAEHLAKASLGSHWETLRKNWIRIHNVSPISVNSSWQYLDFPSERAYTMFILKWS